MADVVGADEALLVCCSEINLKELPISIMGQLESLFWAVVLKAEVGAWLLKDACEGSE